MELKTPLVLYISVAVAVAFGIAAFIYIRRKKKYSGGKKAYLPEYLSKESIYKTRMAWYVVLKYVLIALIITSIILSGYLMARPYKAETKQLANYNRDIILCLDISSSVDNLNATLIDKLKEIVEELNGERFGIVIFNTSPVLLCPLTNDYQYIIRQLDSLKEGLQMRLDYTNKQILPSAKYSQVEAFLENGTLVGFPDRGSSIIGEGLAGAVLDFYDIEEKPDRTRIIIFRTHYINHLSLFFRNQTKADRMGLPWADIEFSPVKRRAKPSGIASVKSVLCLGFLFFTEFHASEIPPGIISDDIICNSLSPAQF